MTHAAPIIASDQLAGNHVQDFAAAMRLVQQECEHEKRANAALRAEAGRTPASDPADTGAFLAHLADSDRGLDEFARAAADAAAIWADELARAVRRAAERIRARGEPMLDDIAAALEAGDYSDLAI